MLTVDQIAASQKAQFDVLFGLTDKAFQGVEKAAAYSRHVYDITAATSAEFTKAFEQQASQAQQAVVGYVDSASKNAPAGTEPVMALFKSSLAASNNAMDSVQKVVKQATEAAQANLQALTTSAVSTAVGAAKTASRKR